MPSLIFSREEFSLATIRGEDTGLCAVAVEVEYDWRGVWRVIATGFISGWDTRFGGWAHATPIVEWLPDSDLDRTIMARAETHYRDAIDEAVAHDLQEEREWA
jgi:hypothetical protein